ncbi:MAG: hypothetical protein H0U49_11935 [Parachlamydiaceae bacterium]|nr:hypothetical protein [Parachlamydiaceae bacterium]
MKNFMIFSFMSAALFFSNLYSQNYRPSSYQNYQSQIAQENDYGSGPARIYPVERASSSDITPEDPNAQARGYTNSWNHEPNKPDSNQNTYGSEQNGDGN